MATFGKRAAPAAAGYAPRAAVAVASMPIVAAPANATPAAKTSPLRVPVATLVILTLLSIVFAFEVHFAPVLYGGMEPSVGTLIAFGAVDGDLVFRHGEWWRLFTAPMLHANLSHLISNGVVLAIVGFMLEPLIGARWFAALYAVGGLGGTVCALMLDAPDIPGVGASGAIMGVLGAAFFCGASAKAGPKGRRMQTWSLRLILPALIPLAANSHVDYAGHLGGVIAGIAMGVVLQLLWSKGEDRPALSEIAGGVGATGLAVGLAALVFAAHFGNADAVTAAATPGLIPDTQLPHSNQVDAATAADLVARYPHDPRAHFYRGLAFLTESHDLADAEEQFRGAIDPADLATAQLDPAFAKVATVLLALTLAYERRPDEARAVGAPVCGFAAESMSDEYATLRKLGVCPGDGS